MHQIRTQVVVHPLADKIRLFWVERALVFYAFYGRYKYFNAISMPSGLMPFYFLYVLLTSNFYVLFMY